MARIPNQPPFGPDTTQDFMELPQPEYPDPSVETEQTPGGPEPGPTTQADPWDTAPADGNWQTWFMTNVQGTPATPATLAALEAKLTKHGIKVLRNAQGVAGKIQLPNGQIVDVGRAFSSGDPTQMAWAWQTDGGGDAETAAVEIDPSYLEPFTEEFATPENAEALSDFRAPGAFSYENFRGPDGQSLQQDPGFQFRVKQGQGMLETSAAAKGLLNSGGTLNDLITYGQELGSQEYQNAFNRDLTAWGANRENAFQKWDTGYRGALDEFSLGKSNRDSNYQKAWNQYLERRNTFQMNQNNPFGKIMQAANTGAQAAAS